ncbi:MAG: hypothetical protein WBW31_13245 [Candidatus Sulfotelmatobacter sp.]
MSRISGSSILSGVVIAILVVALPGAILKIVHSGDLYLFTEHFFQDILARLSGPGRIRFILQPTVAIILGTRSGMKDARAGLPPFLWGLFFHGEHRRELLRSSLASTRNLLAIAILLDLVSQFLIFHEIRPGAALVIGPVLIAVPYVLSRAFSNRIRRSINRHKPTPHVS